MSAGLSRRACRTGFGLAIALALVAPQAVSARAGAGAAATKSRKAKPSAQAKRARAKAAKVVAPPLVLPPQSEPASRMIAWIAAEHDNGGLPYAVIDKQAASLLLFSGKGDFMGVTPVLLGVGIGDDSSPGIGAKDLADIGPAERTTPAGRFVAKFGRAFGRQRVIWVDYANSVALHAVITTHKSEHRVDRLVSPSPDDNRISFGCINVGTKFYTRTLTPAFQKKGGVVYILPDTKSLDDVFPRVRLLPYVSAAVAR
ncbi:hypothetical protein ASF00_17250 [Sphingomonas sp. Leaf34]|uniref:hypothetical protein n=1 Tax=Sphingomonas sp. Leaf34 TaxID=1736216 RepID=UPI0006F86B87|nr:hypothetical protein [Sphingomonas sp. Leaf34]KQN24558.1 hypothetical protein ASF00_17250 [Sphingomonas sp. Leaf34]